MYNIEKDRDRWTMTHAVTKKQKINPLYPFVPVCICKFQDPRFNDFARFPHVHQVSGFHVFHVFHVFDPMRVGARPKKRWQLELEGELAGADAVPEVPKVSKAGELTLTLKAIKAVEAVQC